MRHMFRSCGFVAGMAVMSFQHQAGAVALYSSDDTHLNADILAVYGFFNSRKNYVGGAGGYHWREGFIKYGISGDQRLVKGGSVYGAFSLVSSGTWGEGDPSGSSDGSERTTKIEDAYLGWRSGGLFSALGHDGLDLSLGRQTVKVGRGFIVNDDGLNLGHGAADGSLDRGGTYYLAARHAFDRTAVVRVGGQESWHGMAAWLKSDNRAQANTELALSSLDYTGVAGTLGLTWLHGLSVDNRWASDFQRRRDGMNVFSVRGEGGVGITNANFAFEYATQQSHGNQEQAWYVEGSYQFVGAPWAPSLTARYSRYGGEWDSLFPGQSAGYGTWFQGEVAGNYAGPFNTNTGVTHLALRATPVETLTLGVLFYDFHTLQERNTLNLDAQELDIYAEWAVRPHLIITPLVGLYWPELSANNGGNQSPGSGANLYAQLVVAMPF